MPDYILNKVGGSNPPSSTREDDTRYQAQPSLSIFRESVSDNFSVAGKPLIRHGNYPSCINISVTFTSGW